MNDEFEMNYEDQEKIEKACKVTGLEITDSELRKINKFTLQPLTKEEIFTFKVEMGDNETNDRNYEPFSLKALQKLQKLYIGKTVIKDHSRKTDNQIARIYDTELVSESKLTGAGEPYAKLVAKCYMLNNENNKNLISEIKAGIKREVSTSCRPEKLICNICGTDNMKSYCPHWAGRTYKKENGEVVCMLTIADVKDAYELSFVTVPAQPRAGVIKHKKELLSTKEETSATKNEVKKTDADNTETKMKLLANFAFLKMEVEENEQKNERTVSAD